MNVIIDYMKEVIKQLANSTTEQIIEAFTKIGFSLRDENGDFRNTYDVLKDMSEKYE